LRQSVRLPGGGWFFDDAQRLGSPGGFGEVFSGDDGKGNTVAIKRLKVTAAQVAHLELTRAQELAGKAFHHVLAPLDSGQDANTGGYFLVMPRADWSVEDEVTRPSDSRKGISEHLDSNRDGPSGDRPTGPSRPKVCEHSLSSGILEDC